MRVEYDYLDEAELDDFIDLDIDYWLERKTRRKLVPLTKKEAHKNGPKRNPHVSY